jgi:hypothetical protein
MNYLLDLIPKVVDADPELVGEEPSVVRVLLEHAIVFAERVAARQGIFKRIPSLSILVVETQVLKNGAEVYAADFLVVCGDEYFEQTAEGLEVCFEVGWRLEAGQEVVVQRLFEGKSFVVFEASRETEEVLESLVEKIQHVAGNEFPVSAYFSI